MFRTRLAALLVLLLFGSAVLAAPGNERERKIEQMKAKIQALVKKGEHLKAAGRRDAAEELFHQAEAMEEELRVYAHKTEKARGGRKRPQLEKVLHGLEMGIEALAAIGKEEEVAHLKRIADAVRQRMREMEGAKREIDVARGYLEVMRIAMHGLLELEKRDAADRLEHAIHALELGIEGRKDEKAQQVRRTSPKREELAKLLFLAAECWEDLGHETKAARCAELGHVYARTKKDRGKRESGKRESGKRESGKRESGHRTDKQALVHRLEVLHLAMKALREAEKGDLVDQLERAAHALKVTLEGRKDDEAYGIRKRAPGPGQQAEILAYAARLWKEFGNEDKAGWCMKESKKILSAHAGRREKESEHAREGDDVKRRIEKLERMLEEIHRELQEMKHRR